ncbi:ribonuclease J [Candidatus Orientia mediorientalis]
MNSLIPVDKLVFIPVGGCNEIGMNVNIYHYQGEFIMIDCGAGFPSDFTPGANMLITDLSFIKASGKKLSGLILTHAHEDHLGGVQYLLQDLDCPIYATNFTANFLTLRLKEYDPNCKFVINTITPGHKFNIGPFSIEMLTLTHSAPEMQALMIRTDAGTILHTGDWKFDDDPIIGKKTDKTLLQKYGDEGITALVCDSTNVFYSGFSGSEGDLQKSLIDIIYNASGLIITTTFASNLARLQSLIVAAKHSGRKVILAGKSLVRMMHAARDSGYLNDVNEQLLDIKEFNKYPREKLMIISTGCQGEPLAAVNKIVTGNHQYIKLQPKDTVIFSSKIIPGNEKRIYKLFNHLTRAQVTVITEKDNFVHVSGHPAIEELKTMYKLSQPKMCIPVHGEPMHIHAHANLAKSCGIKHVVELENGSVLQIGLDAPKILGTIKVQYLAIDGNYILPTTSDIFYKRRRMQENGIVIATLIFNHRNVLAMEPILSFPGLLDPNPKDEHDSDYSIVILIKQELHQILSINNSSKKRSIKLDKIQEVTKNCIRRIIKQEVNKNPIIIVNIKKLQRS